MSKFSACGGLFPLYSEVFSPPQAENFDILGPQNDDFRRGIARRRRKILTFWDPKVMILEGK